MLGVFVATQRVANAADAAALAAADATSGAVPGVPCDLAAGVAARNGATLVGCEIDGPVASVIDVVTATRRSASTIEAARPCRAAGVGG